MADISISYAYDALASAERLAQALELQGWSVWWDRTILPGQSHAETILQAIEKAKVVLVLWSRSSVQSEWIRIEATAGVDRNFLILVLVEDVHPPLALSHHQIINLVKWNVLPAHPEFQQLVMRLHSLLALSASAATREELEVEENGDTVYEEQPNAERDLQKRPSRKILLPNIDWVEIPAGQFIYGEGSEQQKPHLDRFQISRYPITNSQYQCFVDAGGYAEERWWQHLKRPGPEKSTWDQPNRPRTDVDWYEAVAFTRWLSAQLNQSIRLPTEQEWEKAGRGTDGRQYPWGDDYINGYANIDESRDKGDSLKQTTAVGLYPLGESPYGVRDMAGNIWEWCLNKYDRPEQLVPDTGGDWRVLRSSSWIDDPGRARMTSIRGFVPDYRDHFGGFRVVLSAPIF